jgi:hypothetical protein
MKWTFFLGACFLTAAITLPHAPPHAVLTGFALAAAITWWWDWRT